MRTLVWFRGKDLRLSDHAPLRDAMAHGEVVPLFVLDPYFFAPERARLIPHRMQFLLESLRALEGSLARLGSRLIVVEGKSTEVVPRLARSWKIDRVVAQRWSEPFARERDRRVGTAAGVPFELFEGETIRAPGTLRTGGGTPFAIYTPFARAWTRSLDIDAPLGAPRSLPALPDDLRVSPVPIPTLEHLGIAHNPRLQTGGESVGRDRLRAFLRDGAADYVDARDRLDVAGTSRLSADLHFGTLSPRTVWVEAHRALEDRSPRALAMFANELLWREFTHATLWDRPELLAQPFRAEWKGFPYVEDPDGWRAWCDGSTGYPVVDAAARQLLGEGFVHNRARMIAASFLTKHLLIDYRRGEQHYLRWLTDGDWAQNNSGWQWSAGCGCDAQPYFRVFNPVIQGKRFDPTGDYVRRWVPELARVPARYIHAPWNAPDSVLRAAKVMLGRDYPRPIVDHAMARARFLDVARSHLHNAR